MRLLFTCLPWNLTARFILHSLAIIFQSSGSRLSRNSLALFPSHLLTNLPWHICAFRLSYSLAVLAWYILTYSMWNVHAGFIRNITTTLTSNIGALLLRFIVANLFSYIYTGLTRNILAGRSWNIYTIFDRYILTDLILNRLLYNFRNIIAYSPLLSPTIIYVLRKALPLCYISTMLFRNFIAFFRWFIMATFLVMDLSANFLGRWSANSFISDRTLLLGHILK